MILACGSVARKTRNRLLTSARGRKHDGHHGCQERVSRGVQEGASTGRAAAPRRRPAPADRCRGRWYHALVLDHSHSYSERGRDDRGNPRLLLAAGLRQRGVRAPGAPACVAAARARLSSDKIVLARRRAPGEVGLERRKERLAGLAHDLGGPLGIAGARRLDEGVVLVVGLLAA